MNGNPELRRGKIMAGKAHYLVLLLGLIFLLQSCGNDAAFDATVLPATQSSTGCTIDGTTGSGPFSCQTVGPVIFHLQATASDPTPVANATVRIDVGNGRGDGVRLLDVTGTTCYGGSPIIADGPDCHSLETKTDDNGVVRFQVLTFPIAGCGTSVVTATSSTFAQVTSSASSGTWTMDNTLTCAAPATTTTTTTSTTTTT